MENQNLYSFGEGNGMNVQTSELDDFLDKDKSDDIDKLDEELVSFEQDVTVVKEEPVLSSLEDFEETSSPGGVIPGGKEGLMSDIEGELEIFTEADMEGVSETEESVQKIDGEESSQPEITSESETTAEGEEVLFSDEQRIDEETIGDEKIVVDEETEKIVQEKIKMYSEDEELMLETSEETVTEDTGTFEEISEQSTDEKKTEDEIQDSISAVEEGAEEEISEDKQPIDSLEESEVSGMQEGPPVSEESNSFFNEDEDETISLSSDELGNILEDTEDLEAETIPTVDSVLQKKIDEERVEN